MTTAQAWTVLNLPWLREFNLTNCLTPGVHPKLCQGPGLSQIGKQLIQNRFHAKILNNIWQVNCPGLVF
jgi:hypothetical protein